MQGKGSGIFRISSNVSAIFDVIICIVAVAIAVMLILSGGIH